MRKNKIACIRAQVEAECKVVERHLSELAQRGGYAAIAHRLERLGHRLQVYEDALVPLLGKQQATTLVAESYLDVMG